MKFVTPSKELAEAHYAEHSARPFFGELVAFLTSGPVVAFVVRGTNVVATARSMIGQTNPTASVCVAFACTTNLLLACSLVVVRILSLFLSLSLSLSRTGS
jgi:hypothetical protein